MNGTKGIDRFAIGVLKACAWVNLIFCGIASFLILHEYGISLVSDEEFLFDYTEKVLNPVAFSASLFSLLFGIFGWAFCLVMAHIAENLIAIKRSQSTLPPGEKGNPDTP
jgi:hypothetical protein